MSVFHKVNRAGKSKVLSPEERSLIQSRLPEKYRLISEVLYWSAGRIQEVLCIRVRNLVPERGMVVLERKTTKTKETREVYLPEHLMKRLVSRSTALGLAPSEPLFFNQSPTESGQSVGIWVMIIWRCMCVIRTTSLISLILIIMQSSHSILNTLRSMKSMVNRLGDP